MTKVIADNINSMFRYKERVFIFLVLGIVITAGVYIFLVQKAIVNVVEREKITKEIRERSTSVSELETKYFSIKSSVNIELAHAKGFKDAEVVSYISKKPITALVSYNEL